MSPAIWMILYAVVLLVFYFVILVQKKERNRMKISLKSQDWIFFLSLIFGGVILGQILLDSGIDFPWEIMMIGLVIFFVALLVFALVKKKNSGRSMVQMMSDERMNSIYAKSSRNGLFTTYLVLFIWNIIVDTDGLDNQWLLIMLGSGFIVTFVSVFVYNFKATRL